MAVEDVDAIEMSQGGFLQSQIDISSSRVNAQLRKRYAVPFADPVPEIILDWVTRMVTRRAYGKRGFNPSSDASFMQLVYEDGKAAEEELTLAANAVDGLYDLPLKQSSSESGIVYGSPRSYSETSPYAWQTHQYNKARREDG